MMIISILTLLFSFLILSNNAFKFILPQYFSRISACSYSNPKFRVSLISHDNDNDNDNESNIDVKRSKSISTYPTFEEIEQFAKLLIKVSTYLSSNEPNRALTVISENIGWLYSKSLPSMIELVYRDMPQSRDSLSLQTGYQFILDFMEITVNQMNTMIQSNQMIMKKLLEAAKVSEQTLDQLFDIERTQLLSSEFLVYLDSELESSALNSELQRLLVTIKLKILEEMGRDKGADVLAISRLVNLDSHDLIEIQTIEYLSRYSDEEKELFLMNLKLMMMEMRKRYTHVDPILMSNLEMIEKIANSLLKVS